MILHQCRPCGVEEKEQPHW